MPGRDKPIGGYYWPEGVDQDSSLETVQEIFRQRGYSLCSDDKGDSKREKVAFFGDRKGCLHVAHRPARGKWTSKMGDLADIEHESLSAISGGLCGGYLGVVMARDSKKPAASESDRNAGLLARLIGRGAAVLGRKPSGESNEISSTDTSGRDEKEIPSQSDEVKGAADPSAQDDQRPREASS